MTEPAEGGAGAETAAAAGAAVRAGGQWLAAACAAGASEVVREGVGRWVAAVSAEGERLAELTANGRDGDGGPRAKRRKQQQKQKHGAEEQSARESGWWVGCPEGTTWEDALRRWTTAPPEWHQAGDPHPQTAVAIPDDHCITWLPPTRATLPMIAAAAGQHAVLSLLLDILPTAALDAQDPVTGASAAHVAAANTAADPHGRCLHALSSGRGGDSAARLLHRVGKGVAPVHTAALHQHLGALEVLRDTLGPSALVAPAKGGWTPAHFVCSGNRDDPAVLQWLVDVCPDAAGAVDKLGRTALHVAARRGHLQCVRALAGLGSHALPADSQGATAVHAAAYGGHTDVVRALVDVCGSACLRTSDNDGRLPLTCAQRQGHDDVVACMVMALPELAEAGSGGDGATTVPLGVYRVSDIERKRRQRVIFMTAVRDVLGEGEGSGGRPPVVMLLDDAGMPAAGGARAPPSGEGGKELVSTERSCAGDLLRCGVAAPPVEVVVPNPSAAALAAIAADCDGAPHVHLRQEVCGATVAALAGSRRVAAVWLDYCNSLDHGTNRADVAALFTNGMLRCGTPCAVAFTFSWRGAQGGRDGQPKDGRAYLDTVRSCLTEYVTNCARDGGYTVERAVQPFVQQGQLFFGVFACRAEVEWPARCSPPA